MAVSAGLPLQPSNNWRCTCGAPKVERTGAYQLMRKQQLQMCVHGAKPSSQISALHATMCEMLSERRDAADGPATTPLISRPQPHWSVVSVYMNTILLSHCWHALLHTWLARTFLCHDRGLTVRLTRRRSRGTAAQLRTFAESMESWVKGLPAPKKMKQQPAARMVTGDADDIRHQIINLVAKLTLKHELAISQLEAATFHTILSTKDDPYLIEHQNAIREFFERVQPLQKQVHEGKDARSNQAKLDDEGEPHIFGWSAMVIAALADESAPKDAQEVLKQRADSITDPKMLLDQVFVCRTRKCYDKRQLRVHFSVHPTLEPVLAALIKCFVNRVRS